MFNFFIKKSPEKENLKKLYKIKKKLIKSLNSFISSSMENSVCRDETDIEIVNDYQRKIKYISTVINNIENKLK